MATYVPTGDGARLWTESTGLGPPLILCNGGPGCCDYLRPVAEMIEDRMTVVRWEQRGCGRSSSDGPYDLETTLQDIEAIRKFYGFEQIAIGGHSWGADLALTYALEFRPNVTSLLYISGTGVQNDRDWKEAYERHVDTDLDPLPTFEFPINGRVNQEGVVSWRRYIKTPDLLRRIADLALPALFIYAEEDIRPDWPAKQVARLMNAEFISIIGAPHCLWLTHEAELRRALKAMPAIDI